MGYNALAVAEPVLFDHGRWIDRFRQGEADGLERGRRDLMRQAGSMVAGGDMRGARNALAVGGELDAAFGIDDRQTAAEDRSWERGWQQKSRARQENLWGREDQQWGQGQSDAALARKQKVAALYTSAVQAAGGDPAKLAQVKEVLRAAGVEIPQEFSQPGGQEAAAVLAGPGEQMTPYQREQIALEREKMARKPAVDLAPVDKKAILEAEDTAATSESAISGLDRALQLHDQAYSGLLANERAAIGGVFGAEGALATQELNNVITGQALENLKAIFGGMPTEGERQILMQIQGSAEQPADVRKAILQRARAAAVNRLNLNRAQAEAIRSGDFYQPGYKAPPQQSTEPVRISGDADYSTLPSGTEFIAPDGTLRVKP